MNVPMNYQPAALPADPAQMQDMMQRYADAYAETERRAGVSIRINNGIMSVGGQPIAGNMFAGIVVDVAHINTFYGSSYNPNVIMPPICYAVARQETELVPHPDMAKAPHYFRPQAAQCLGCPQNEFGTARQGQGKACQNRRRLLVLVAGTYAPGQYGPVLQPINDLQHYASSPLYTLSLPPTSTAGWGAFVRDVAGKYRLPPFGVIARIYLYPHPKHQREAIGFEPLGPVPTEWQPTILQRWQEATQEVLEGFDPPAMQQPQQPGGGFHGAQQAAMAQQGGYGASQAPQPTYQPQGPAPWPQPGSPGLGQGVAGHPGFAR